jgi:bacteriocin biosynthesis cyclodehydratase domain-containing protein
MTRDSSTTGYSSSTESSLTTAPLARPTLLPGLRRLWRSRQRLQLGVDPGRAVVLELPDHRAARLLDLLDGTRSERVLLTEAGRCGIREPHARALLDALRAAGLVVGAQTLLPHNLPEPVRRRLADEAASLALRGTDAPATPAQILRRRAAARVAITGRGRLVAPVALALAQAGVGHVATDHAGAGHVAPASGGVGPVTPAVDGLAAEIDRVAPGTKTTPLRRGEATFAVHAGPTGPASLAAAGYARHRLPHLALAVRDSAVLVGPLVPPQGRPCLNCLDLHRIDRDPAWPQLAAQLAVPDREPCAAATLLSAAGLATGEVLSWLDGEAPATVGAVVEVAAPGRLRRRSWPPHPRCHCNRHTSRTMVR